MSIMHGNLTTSSQKDSKEKSPKECSVKRIRPQKDCSVKRTPTEPFSKASFGMEDIFTRRHPHGTINHKFARVIDLEDSTLSVPIADRELERNHGRSRPSPSHQQRSTHTHNHRPTETTSTLAIARRQRRFGNATPFTSYHSA